MDRPDLDAIIQQNRGLGEYTPERQAEFLEALTWRGNQLPVLVDYARTLEVVLIERMTADTQRQVEVQHLRAVNHFLGLLLLGLAATVVILIVMC